MKTIVQKESDKVTVTTMKLLRYQFSFSTYDELYRTVLSHVIVTNSDEIIIFGKKLRPILCATSLVD